MTNKKTETKTAGRVMEMAVGVVLQAASLQLKKPRKEITPKELANCKGLFLRKITMEEAGWLLANPEVISKNGAFSMKQQPAAKSGKEAI